MLMVAASLPRRGLDKGIVGGGGGSGGSTAHHTRDPLARSESPRHPHTFASITVTLDPGTWFT